MARKKDTKKQRTKSEKSPPDQAAPIPEIVSKQDVQEELIQFTSVQIGYLKLPSKNQLKKFKVPETDMTVNGNTINFNSKLPGATASDLTLTMNQDSVIIMCKNKKVAYYTEIKLSDQIIPQSAVAKFGNETLSLKVLKLDSNNAPWDGIVQINNLSKELKEMKDKHTTFQQQYHGLQLEYQNLLVKSKKEVESKIDAYKISVIENLLINIDNFERALESTTKIKNKNNEQILVGINLILNELRNMILEEGVQEIVSEGMLLDPHQHEVLDYEETVKVPENTVVKVYQKGYRYKDRVLRPSRVKIAISPKQKMKKKSKLEK